MKAGQLLLGVAAVLVVAIVVAVVILQGNGAPSGSDGTGDNGPAAPLGERTKTDGCAINGGLQDHACTPGAIISSAGKEQICKPGYAKSVRNVPEAEKNQVYAEYGIRSHRAGEYEVDHLVSLELGGSNDIANLWPEAAEPRPGFHEKDRFENYLHDQVCSGALSLQDAQRRIANDWLRYWTDAGRP